MFRIRLGGIKIIQGRAHLSASCAEGERALPKLCSCLAGHRINLRLLTYIADIGGGTTSTDLCIGHEHGPFGQSLLSREIGSSDGVAIHSKTDILSVFPHDQKPAVTGAVLGFLAKRGITPEGIASSPSAVSILVPAEASEAIVAGLPAVFDLPAQRAPVVDWHAAYAGKDQVLKEIVCSYDEQVIKVYNITRVEDLDLWNITLPGDQLDRIGQALSAMDDQSIRLPFLVLQRRGDQALRMAFCFPGHYRETVRELLAPLLAPTSFFRIHPTVTLFLHGPHFGDRFGIAHALAGALHRAGIPILALSCAVSSVSLVLEAAMADAALEALRLAFDIPA